MMNLGDLQGHSMALHTKQGLYTSVIVSIDTRQHVMTADYLSTSSLWRFAWFETTMKLPWNYLLKNPHELCARVKSHVKCTQQSHTHVQWPPYLLSCMPVSLATANLPMPKRKSDIRSYFDAKGRWFRVHISCVGAYWFDLSHTTFLFFC